MHLKSFLLLAASALQTSTVAAAPLEKRDPRAITFCDYPGAEQWNRCVTETIQWGVCRPIPDSNNLGDSGSNWAVSHILRITSSPFLPCSIVRSSSVSSRSNKAYLPPQFIHPSETQTCRFYMNDHYIKDEPCDQKFFALADEMEKEGKFPYHITKIKQHFRWYKCHDAGGWPDDPFMVEPVGDGD